MVLLKTSSLVHKATTGYVGVRNAMTCVKKTFSFVIYFDCHKLMRRGTIYFNRLAECEAATTPLVVVAGLFWRCWCREVGWNFINHFYKEIYVCCIYEGELWHYSLYYFFIHAVSYIWIAGSVKTLRIPLSVQFSINCLLSDESQHRLWNKKAY